MTPAPAADPFRPGPVVATGVAPAKGAGDAIRVEGLLMGWAIGLLVVAFVMRYGLGAESLAWAIIFAVAPISGVYYPISNLPDWLQPVAWALPSSSVFEGMRAVMIERVFRTDLLLQAVALNAVYLAGGWGMFLLSFRVARERDLLLHVGE